MAELPQWAIDYIEREYYQRLGDEWENQIRAHYGVPLLPTRDAVLPPTASTEEETP